MYLPVINSGFNCEEQFNKTCDTQKVVFAHIYVNQNCFRFQIQIHLKFESRSNVFGSKSTIDRNIAFVFNRNNAGGGK